MLPRGNTRFKRWHNKRQTSGRVTKQQKYVKNCDQQNASKWKNPKHSCPNQAPEQLHRTDMFMLLFSSVSSNLCTRSTHITHHSHATIAAIHCNLWCLRRRAWTFGHFGEKFQEVLHVSLLAENNHDEGSWPKERSERPHKILRVDPKWS